MQVFHPKNKTKSPHHERVYAVYEIWYTAVDFSAAFLFLVGSILFFWKSTETVAIWMFVVGSFFFAMKPTIRLARELKYLRMGDYGDLAERDES